MARARQHLRFLLRLFADGERVLLTLFADMFANMGSVTAGGGMTP